MRSTMLGGWIMTLLLVTCATMGAEKDPVLVTEADNGKTVKAVVGQTIQINIDGNPTTGFSWTVAKIEGKSVVQVGKLEYKQAGEPKPGAGGTYTGTFKAVKAGKGTVRMEYKRPWEKGKPPEKTFVVNVQVTGK